MQYARNVFDFMKLIPMNSVQFGDHLLNFKKRAQRQIKVEIHFNKRTNVPQDWNILRRFPFNKMSI